MQSRREKEELEKFIQRQTETTDNIVSRLKDTMTNLIENQKVKNTPHRFVFVSEFIPLYIYI